MLELSAESVTFVAVLLCAVVDASNAVTVDEVSKSPSVLSASLIPGHVFMVSDFTVGTVGFVPPVGCGHPVKIIAEINSMPREQETLPRFPCKIVLNIQYSRCLMSVLF